MKQIYDGLIPIDADENRQLHYANGSHGNWIKNHVFDATLQYQGFSRGQSAAYVEWVNAATGRCYTMFLKDLDTVLRACLVITGTIDAKWTYCKRGQNYGICLAPGDVAVTNERVMTLDEWDREHYAL